MFSSFVDLTEFHCQWPMHCSDGGAVTVYSGGPCINVSPLCGPTSDTNVWDKQVWTAFYHGVEVFFTLALSSHSRKDGNIRAPYLRPVGAPTQLTDLRGK